MRRIVALSVGFVLVAPCARAAVGVADSLAPNAIRRPAKRSLSRAARLGGGRLQPLAAPWRHRNPEEPLQPKGLPTTADGRLLIEVTMSAADDDAVAALARRGLAVEAIDRGSGRIQGAVAADAVEQLAGLRGVRRIRPVDPAFVRAGTFTTEGDVASGAAQLRTLGLTGAGVVVGVISDGIDALAAAQASGELGAVSVPGDPRCRAGSGDEGTALLEIVHDLAPGASLLFSGPQDSVQMAESVQCLTDAGADVIVDDLGFLGEPWFQDGPVAQAVKAAVASGVSYHSAAGNEAESHWEGDYRASPGTPYHDFLGGPVDNTNSIVVDAQSQVVCVLQWADPAGGSANDYDLYFVDAGLNVVAASEDVQSGSQDPIEIVGVVNGGASPAVASLVISLYAGSPRHLEVVCVGGSIPEYDVPAGSIIGHPAVPEVVAVAAIDASDPGLDDVEPFSSRGPSLILFPSAVARPKPDIAAFDGVTISNAGGFPLCPPYCRFFGTSAAAPHSAGVAALLRAAQPGATPGQVQQALRTGAFDVGAPGFDAAAGYGRLDAVGALAALSGATTSTSPASTSTTAASTTTVASTSSLSSTSELPTSTTAASPTTTLPSACAAACPDDDDPCNGTPRCEAGIGCVPGDAVGGVDGIRCRLARIAAGGVCGRDALGRFAGRVTRKAAGAEQTAAALDAALGKARRKRARRLLRQVRALGTVVERGTAKGIIARDCGMRLRAVVSETESLSSAVH